MKRVQACTTCLQEFVNWRKSQANKAVFEYDEVSACVMASPCVFCLQHSKWQSFYGMLNPAALRCIQQATFVLTLLCLVPPPPLSSPLSFLPPPPLCLLLTLLQCQNACLLLQMPKGAFVRQKGTRATAATCCAPWAISVSSVCCVCTAS